MSLSLLVSFKSRFVTYLLNFPRTFKLLHSSFQASATVLFRASLFWDVMWQ